MNITKKIIELASEADALRSGKHIDDAIQLLGVKKADAVISACEMDYYTLWPNILPQDNSMVGFLKDETYAYAMNKISSIDIAEQTDFDFCKYKIMKKYEI